MPCSWLGTILYMGVLVGEYPTNLLLQKLPVAKYLAVNVFCWGAVIACSAAATNFAGLMTVRFLLGIFEACVQPAFIIMYVQSVPHAARTQVADSPLQDFHVVYKAGASCAHLDVVLYDWCSADGECPFLDATSGSIEANRYLSTGRWYHCLGSLPLHQRRYLPLAAAFPRPRLGHLCLGRLHWLVAA